ncbi:MAG: 4Fe-4S dicluster domain-containing protein, partial [Calditrichaeota bacterium]|nr:4Fe-4S dicluster domain-containing protein [Calditrichota bacterium]
LDRFVPYPVVGGRSTSGGLCGPAVKPIALHMVGVLAKDPHIGIPISAIGGISTWRDAAEFIAIGATTVQICTAVMHYGYRIIDGLVDGLSNYLEDHNMKSVSKLIGRAVPALVDWGDLDLNYRVVADINPETCIGCQLCVVACQDGAHQCIYVPTSEVKPGHIAPRAVEVKRKLAANPDYRVPWVDETDCIGCNLCALICPVPDCITMKPIDTGLPFESWNDRVRKGTAFVPGGLHD